MEEKDCIILISHSNYRIKSAGVERYLTEIVALLSQKGIQSLQIFPVIEVNKKTKSYGREYIGMNVNGTYGGIYNEKDLYELLLMLKRKHGWNYMGVHINHLYGWNLPLLAEALTKIQLPIKIVIHDYEMVCADMLKPDGKGPACRKVISRPDEGKCRGCKYEGYDIPRFEKTKAFLDKISPLVENVVAPSEIAGKAWVGVFGEFKDKLVIREHLTISGSHAAESVHVAGRKIRIAYIGSTAPLKGFAEWGEVVKHLPKDKYEAFYFGKDTREQEYVKNVYVDFLDKSLVSMTGQLMKNGIDIAFLWSTCLETYCYTAYEACEAGCYLLSNRCSGNIAAMIGKFGCGKVFDSLAQCEDFLEDTDIVEAELAKFRKDEKVPAFTPNPSEERLMFLPKDNSPGIQPSGTENVKVNARQCCLLTYIYKIARGRRYSQR